MLYELTASSNLAQQLRQLHHHLHVAEPPMGYRRRGRTRVPPDETDETRTTNRTREPRATSRRAETRANHANLADRARHVPTERIERLVRARDDEARWKRILLLNEYVSSGTRGEVHAAWLQLEESLHEHWLDVALEHYHTGFEAGFETGLEWASRAADTESALSPRDRLRALLAALARIVEELDD